MNFRSARQVKRAGFRTCLEPLFLFVKFDGNSPICDRMTTHRDPVPCFDQLVCQH